MKKRKNQRGGSILEFGLASLFLVPVATGTFVLGLSLTSYLKVTSVCRSTGSMFVRGADFSTPLMKRVLIQLSGGLGLGTGETPNTSGPMVVTVTQLLRIGTTECLSVPQGQTCNNKNKVVIIKRLRIGNNSLRGSDLGTPTGGSPAADGAYSSNFYLVNTSAAVPAFGVAPNDTEAVATAPIDLRAGEMAYVAEVFVRAPAYVNMAPRLVNIDGFYAKNYF